MRDFSDVRTRLANAQNELDGARGEVCHSPVEDRLIDLCYELIMALALITSDLEINREINRK